VSLVTMRLTSLASALLLLQTVIASPAETEYGSLGGPHRPGTTCGTCGPAFDQPCPRGHTTCPGTGLTSVRTRRTAGPAAASVLGDVATTTVSGTDTRTSKTLPVGENIYGPFEAGFSTQQNGILQGLGCNPGSNGHIAAGYDTKTAEGMVAHQCGVTLPRIENTGADGYISLLDECGGHTNDYHFHERLSCLYTSAAGSGHSPKIGQSAQTDTRYLYGKWENYATSTLPQLDACGGHFGVTPDSNGASVYHYHVQNRVPFTIGCFGPDKDSNNQEVLMSVARCRALYTGGGSGPAAGDDGCGGSTTTVTTKIDGVTSTVQYDNWCPCYDANGSNVGTAELPALAASPTPTPTPPTPTPPTPTPPTPTPPTPTPPTPTPPTPTPSPSTVTYAVSFSHISANQYVGDTKTATEKGYGRTLGIVDTSTNQYKTGNSVSSSATRRTASVVLVATVAPAQQASANSASVTSTTLQSNIAAAASAAGTTASANVPTTAQIAVSTSSSDNNTGIIVGAAVGGAVGFIILVGLIYYFACYSKTTPPAGKSPPTTEATKQSGFQAGPPKTSGRECC